MELERLLKALGEPTRLKIFQCLLERRHCVRSLSKKLKITESAISQHMKVMRKAGLIYGEKYGYHTHYFPSQEAVDFLLQTFSHMLRQCETLVRDASVCSCEYGNEAAK